jgi:hypothetical protein
MGEVADKYDSYFEDLKKDVTITEVSIHDKTLMCPALKVKWIKIYHDECKIMKRLKQAEKQMMDAAVKANSAAPRFKIEEVLKSDGRFMTIKEAIVEQEQLVSMLKDVVTMMGQFGFDIGNAVKLMAIENA